MVKGIKSRLGKCYQLVGSYALRHPDVILVHGTINGSRRTGVDFDNPHAWIEEKNEVVFDLVWDTRLPKDVYFRLMEAKELKRYNHKALRKMVLKFKNWGLENKRS